MYWEIGKRIFEEEQEGKDRADYGKYLTQFIAQEIEPEFGSGFSKRQIEIISTVLSCFSNCERTAFAIELDAIQALDATWY